jgi:hypothetical protein
MSESALERLKQEAKEKEVEILGGNILKKKNETSLII